jgi:Carboxypeptidase regulatory-like domain
MTSKNEAKLNMYNAVAAFAQTNAAVINTIPALTTAVAAFNVKRQQLIDAAEQEAQVIVGITQNKTNLKKSLCQTAASHAAALFALAASLGDEELKAKAKMAASDLFKLKDDELTVKMQNLSADITANQAGLVAYGITPAMLTAFNTLITAYSNAVPSPRNAASIRKAAAELLKNLFKETDAILKLQVDKIALQFKNTNKPFHDEYRSNRVIVNAPVQNTKLTGTVKASANNQNLADVLVQVLNTAYTGSTNGSGKYLFKVPVSGTFSISFTKTGYVPKTINNVIIILGQTTELNTSLDAV